MSCIYINICRARGARGARGLRSCARKCFGLGESLRDWTGPFIHFYKAYFRCRLRHVIVTSISWKKKAIRLLNYLGLSIKEEFSIYRIVIKVFFLFVFRYVKCPVMKNENSGEA